MIAISAAVGVRMGVARQGQTPALRLKSSGVWAATSGSGWNVKPRYVRLSSDFLQRPKTCPAGSVTSAVAAAFRRSYPTTLPASSR